MARARRNRTSSAVAIQPAVRCAIYTRKSTDEGLDKHFNSLDNQRERAEAYITSQADEGWAALPTRYDDGGFSGGTADRPALKRLLADVEAGEIDTILVYKLDRMSRSLVDFVQIHGFLEQHDVALVSVTESINTSTAHGRMMVNILLSFAQYERELVSERTRDKMSAARRKGKWTGGTPPLGYDVAPEGGRLVVNKDEAVQVEAIFRLYAENPSLIRVVRELNRRGWTTKSWTTKTGNQRRGSAWCKKTVRQVLTDPLYIGKQKLGGETFPGEHRAIVPKRLFDEVQRLLDENRSTGGGAIRNGQGFLLRGLLQCAACDSAMTPTWTRPRGRLYRYYTCSQGQNRGECSTGAVPADEIESFVVDQIRRIGRDADLQEQTFRRAVAEIKAHRRGLRAEQKRLVRDLETVRAEVERLVETLSRTDGAAAEAVAAKLNDAQSRVAALEQRQIEIKDELATLTAAAIDRDDVARALEAFDPLWDVLLTPEKERVLGLLIDRIDYDGDEMRIAWRLAGFGELAGEVSS